MDDGLMTWVVTSSKLVVKETGGFKSLTDGQWAARTQAPTTTNYDVGSPTWGDLRLVPLLCAMEVTNLGHRP
ncbi:hypothetical protein VNO77_18450 [Canavalia gladiata]|uniref:Uncharacterized protein n=1 Tax=Canavalia gladiata TaxID=3824 RepID=A0AAN9QJM9_CANGL